MPKRSAPKTPKKTRAPARPPPARPPAPRPPVVPGDPKDKMIRLDQLLKLTNAASTGAEAKYIIRDGAVKVNGEVETRRGRKLYVGDAVELGGEELVVDDALLAREAPPPE